jgi:hypothetical protein
MMKTDPSDKAKTTTTPKRQDQNDKTKTTRPTTTILSITRFERDVQNESLFTIDGVCEKIN